MTVWERTTLLIAAWLILYLITAVIVLWDRQPLTRGALLSSPLVFPVVGVLAIALGIPIALRAGAEWIAAQAPRIFRRPAWLVRLQTWLDHPVQVLPRKEKP